jgi:hypothetical protein
MGLRPEARNEITLHSYFTIIVKYEWSVISFVASGLKPIKIIIAYINPTICTYK